MTYEQLVHLGSQPARRRHLPSARFMHVVIAACLAYATDDERFDDGAIRRLYAEAVRRLDSEQRRQMVIQLARFLEENGRMCSQTPAEALELPLLLDPDPSVVSTAALELAQVTPCPPHDALGGCRYVLQFALRQTGLRRAAILAGLAALSDRRVYDLLALVWNDQDETVCASVLETFEPNVLTVPAIEFVLRAAEDAQARGRAGMFGSAIGTLVRLARELGTARAEGPEEEGVPDIERVFPSWAAPEEKGPIVIRHFLPRLFVGEIVCGRLAALAGREREPKIVPIAIAAWQAACGWEGELTLH